MIRNTSLKYKKKIFKIIDLLFYKKKKIFSYSKLDIFESRILENLTNQSFSENIILTTYFNSKKNPQFDSYVEGDDFGYIKNFYESVQKNNLNAVIFHDGLSDEFIRKYSNENVSFIKCEILKFSLNDERFYIYKEFLSSVKLKKVILCDVNDVTFGSKEVFRFIEKEKFYIGRDVILKIGQDGFMKNKIDILPQEMKKKLNGDFNKMPIVNAGVIGGEIEIVSSFLEKLIYLFESINNDLNNNMLCVNLVFYDAYWINYCNSIEYKIKSLVDNDFRSFKKLKYVRGNKFFFGYPFTSLFKKYEKDIGAYIYHK